MATLEFFSPAGVVEITKAHARRIPSLAGKKVAFLSNDEWQSERSLPLLRQFFEGDHAGIEILDEDQFPKGVGSICDRGTVDLVKRAGADAVVLASAACGTCATACGDAAALLEAEGVPAVVLAREDFASIIRNAVSGHGLPGDIPMVTFPMDFFMPDSDMSDLETKRGQFYAGLTDWSAKVAASDKVEMLEIESATYEGAITKANNIMLTNLWGDGLPLWPATRDRVDWILEGTDLRRDNVLGKFPPRGAVVTIESCAIALAMAGGRPEYMPVLVAAVEALLDPAANTAQMQATSGASFPVVIVNGPIARNIRLSSGFGCLGPDPQHPAGSSIGRALRQMQQNLGGALPGIGTLATWGANRTTNVVFAEDDEGLPPGWLPHGTDRHAYARGENSISLFWATGASNLARGSAPGKTMEQDVKEGLFRMAEQLSVPQIIHYCEGYEEGTPGAVIISRTLAKQLDAQGFTSKDHVRDFLWTHSAIEQERLSRCGGTAWINKLIPNAYRADDDQTPWPITRKSSNIILIVSGGAHPMHSFWMTAFSQHVVGRPVTTPQRFESLLLDADRDLGCGAEMCVI